MAISLSTTDGLAWAAEVAPAAKATVEAAKQALMDAEIAEAEVQAQELTDVMDAAEVAVEADGTANVQAERLMAALRAADATVDHAKTQAEAATVELAVMDVTLAEVVARMTAEVAIAEPAIDVVEVVADVAAKTATTPARRPLSSGALTPTPRATSASASGTPMRSLSATR